jgi:hypothetical protein
LRADLPNELEGLSVPRCRDGLHWIENSTTG